MSWFIETYWSIFKSTFKFLMIVLLAANLIMLVHETIINAELVGFSEGSNACLNSNKPMPRAPKISPQLPHESPDNNRIVTIK